MDFFDPSLMPRSQPPSFILGCIKSIAWYIGFIKLEGLLSLPLAPLISCNLRWWNMMMMNAWHVHYHLHLSLFLCVCSFFFTDI